MPDLFIASLSGASARQAVVEESAACGWLYMTGPEGAEPVADCFLYNMDNVPAASSDSPPPLPEVFASAYRVRLPVTEDDVAIVWSPKGDAVAVRIHGEFVAFIGPDDPLGYSRTVKEDCDWAHPFDVELFRKLFEAV